MCCEVMTELWLCRQPLGRKGCWSRAVWKGLWAFEAVAEVRLGAGTNGKVIFRQKQGTTHFPLPSLLGTYTSLLCYS